MFHSKIAPVLQQIRPQCEKTVPPINSSQLINPRSETSNKRKMRSLSMVTCAAAKHIPEHSGVLKKREKSLFVNVLPILGLQDQTLIYLTDSASCLFLQFLPLSKNCFVKVRKPSLADSPSINNHPAHLPTTKKKEVVGSTREKKLRSL